MTISDRMVEHLAELKRAKKKMGNLESELNKARLALADIDLLKADLATKKQAWVAVTKLESWDSSYIAATQAQDKVVANEAALAQLKVVASGPVYEQVFNRGSGKLQ